APGRACTVRGEGARACRPPLPTPPRPRCSTNDRSRTAAFPPTFARARPARSLRTPRRLCVRPVRDPAPPLALITPSLQVVDRSGVRSVLGLGWGCPLLVLVFVLGRLVLGLVVERQT